MTTAAEFEAALRRLKVTNEPQTLGSFTFTRLENSRGHDGWRHERKVQRIDWLTKETCGELVAQVGGLRYWPATDFSLRAQAEQYAREEAAEMQRRCEALAA